MGKEHKKFIIINCVFSLDRLDPNVSLGMYVPSQCHKALFIGTCDTLFAIVVW